MVKKPSILIMMTTYNGEKYLEEQIKSIIGQSYLNWNLIIQDDGSIDKTNIIIDEFCNNDSRIKKESNNSLYHGAYYNFHSLANKCKKIKEYDFYMFCDQDDVWDKNKIETFLNIVNTKKSEQEQPIFIYADMRLIDSVGNIIDASMDAIVGLKYKNVYNTFFSHNVFGCNTFMNKAAFFAVPEINIENENIGILSHDNLYAKFSAILGTVIYSDKCLMSYRRHELNVTAKQKYNLDIHRIVERIFNINDLARDHALTYNQSLITINLIKEKYKKEDMCLLLSEIEDVLRSGGFKAIKFIINKNISWGKPVKNISRRIILLLGIYKRYIVISP